MTTTSTRLKKLSETNHYDVANESHDIRGWSVVAATGEVLGKVDDMLFDTTTDQVRYVIVETEDRHVLIPLGALGFENDARRVVANGFALDRLRSLAPYEAGMVNTDAERAYYLAFVPGFKAEQPLDYGIPVFSGSLPKREVNFVGSEPPAQDLLLNETGRP
jgi:sporulation protein YlmC with PRC-barrel domain